MKGNLGENVKGPEIRQGRAISDPASISINKNYHFIIATFMIVIQRKQRS
jgi:hypothetical protein